LDGAQALLLEVVVAVPESPHWGSSSIILLREDGETNSVEVIGLGDTDNGKIMFHLDEYPQITLISF
jgi:hypothetical protein